MNEKLIKTLCEERDKLYPNGFPINLSRGYAKTYVHMSHYIRYTAYDFVCDVLRAMGCVGKKMTLDEAHKMIDEHINRVCNKIKEGF